MGFVISTVKVRKISFKRAWEDWTFWENEESQKKWKFLNSMQSRNCLFVIVKKSYDRLTGNTSTRIKESQIFFGIIIFSSTAHCGIEQHLQRPARVKYLARVACGSQLEFHSDTYFLETSAQCMTKMKLLSPFGSWEYFVGLYHCFNWRWAYVWEKGGEGERDEEVGERERERGGEVMYI